VNASLWEGRIMSILQKQGESKAGEDGAQRASLRWFFGFFVVSGFCGLLYEVVWLRLAMASFGVTTALASIVISMFMAGLGLGSWGAGAWTRRTLAADGRRVLRFYSLAELLVGVSSLAVPLELKLGRLLLQRMGSLGTWQSAGYYLFAGVLVALTLVPWCTCMGSTFPLLMSVIRQAGRGASQRSFSYLYVANVLGALLGTLLSAFVLIELLGFQGTLYVAGSLNALLAIFAFALSFTVTSTSAIEKPAQERAAQPRLYGLPRSSALVFLFATGFASMGMEVVWIRQYTPYLGNLVYAFAGILAVYLLATVLGSLDYRSHANSRKPDESIPAWSQLALFAIVPLVLLDPRFSLGAIPVISLRLCGIVLFCALLGYLTPFLIDCWSSGDPDRAGSAYAVNIAGSIAGPLVASFWLLPWMGERWSILILSVPLFVIAAVTAFHQPQEATRPGSGTDPRVKFALATVAAILLFSISRDFETIFPKREVKRDYAATVVATGEGFNRSLLVNGVGMTSLTPITKYIAHLPMAFMSSPPKNGLVICFGMGTSFRSMLSWGIPTTSVDLIPSVPALFGYYHADAPQLLRSPQAHIVIDDGRRFLDGSSESYDVIVVDPPPPVEAAGSSLLYSREFYEVIKKHLRQGGIVQIWYPESVGNPATTASIAKALMESFPSVRAFHSYDHFGIHFLASMEPIPVTSSAVLASRLSATAAADFVEWGPQATPQQQFEEVLSREISLESIIAQAPRIPAMRDDQPINEYFLLRDWFHSYR
jgi:predicted membrane-bound spermidine synthase